MKYLFIAVIALNLVFYQLEKKGRTPASLASSISCIELLGQISTQAQMELLLKNLSSNYLNELLRKILHGRAVNKDFERLDELVDDRLLKRLRKGLQRLDNDNPRVVMESFEHAFEPNSVSGDFMRVIELDDGRLSFFLGDIEGHGKTAGIRAVQVEQFFAKHDDFQEFYNSIENINAEHMLKHLDTQMNFDRPEVGMLNVLFDPQTGVLQYASAKMPYLRIKKQSGELVTLKATGPSIGSVGDYSYRLYNSPNIKYQLAPGDMVIMMSDGMEDAKDMLAIDLGPQLNNLFNLSNSPQELMERVLGEIKLFRDDSTMLVFRWIPD